MKNRAGFSMIEMALSLIVMSSILVGLIIGMRSSNEDLNRAKERDFSMIFDNALKTNFESILSAFEPVCSKITSDSQSTWGNTKFNKTSPFPKYISPNIIEYTLELNTLTASKKARLINSIVNSFSPYCKLDSSSNSKIDILCPSVVGLTYNLGAGSVNTAHTLGSDINPNIVPSYSMIFKRKQKNGNVVKNVTYNGSFQSVYNKRRNYTLSKWNTIRNLAKQFYETRMSLEIANSPSAGLNSSYDEFVPYFWEIFGNSNPLSSYPVCSVTGSTCSNLNTNSYWQSGTSIAPALIMRRLIQNLSLSSIYTVDGFNNMVRVYPILTDCTGNDLTACNIKSPPIPQKNYQNQKQPPYISSIYIGTCKNPNSNNLEYCNMLIAY